MQEKERIPVYANIVKGKTVCLCHRDRKGCGKNCEKDFVSRDRFEDWQKTMKQDRYGKCKL